MVKRSQYINRQVPIRKARRVLEYMAKIDLDPDQALAAIGMRSDQFQQLNDSDLLSVADFSKLYGASVKQMQLLRKPIPWAAGIGSDAFEMMCHSVITCKSLGDVLQRAQRFDTLLYPLLGYRMSIETNGPVFELHYQVRTQSSDAFVPERWDWAEHFETVSHVSGLSVWYKFCAWLIGKDFDLLAVQVAAPFVSASYERGTNATFRHNVSFDADRSCIKANSDLLNRRVVHSPESLQRFLDNSVYELIATAETPASTSSAIRSLVARDFNDGMPTFNQMAGFLHCSESSLRRRLQQEDTSYQEIKDQLRCEFAVEHLRNRDTRINELSELLGFAEPSSFVRSFRGWVGVTPSDYREQFGASQTGPS